MPAHRVAVDGFWMDHCIVTNEPFRRFVEATKHVTSAEVMGYRTPNIDRIANEGMVFTDHYGQPSCTADRVKQRN